jgi:outer membrane protein assembly factor BamB
MQHPAPRSHRPALSLPIALAAALAAMPLPAADWPQWRGPERDGKSAETGLLPRWQEGGPPLVWQSGGLGDGFSSLAVVDGHIYTLGDIEGVQHAMAIDAAGGKLLWSVPVGKPWEAYDPKLGGSRSTPTVDGNRLYLVTTDGQVVCLERATGKQVWSRSLTEDWGGRMMRSGGTSTCATRTD